MSPGDTVLRHSKVELALHRLRDDQCDGHPPLLLLHGLGERSPAQVPASVAAWPGAVVALDFTGHGESSVPAGGGYTCEVLMADVDTALDELGPSTVLGRGLGAYVALLIAGARPELVHGAVLTDGPGLFGGPSTPSSSSVVSLPATPSPPDPYALVELTRDVRPPDYAASFVRQSVNGSNLEIPFTVAAIGRPPWLEAVVGELGVQEASVAEGLGLYAGAWVR